MDKYPKLFDDFEYNTKKTFPHSPIILAVCSPYQQNIGNILILQLLLECRVGRINTVDSKGTVFCILMSSYSLEIPNTFQQHTVN